MAQNQQLSVLAQVAPTTTGTAGQVLTSAGSSSPAYWGSAAGGIVGYTGSAGAGYTGSAGTSGSVGYVGSAGAGYTGSAGVGYTGSAGAGYTGSGGLGYTGSSGAGYTGSAGTAGSVGYTGSASTVAGYAGSAGPAGGYTGSSGYTGSAITISYTAVRQQFTGDGTTTVFAVSGGYTTGAISVFYNGTLMRNGSDVTVTNGSTIIFAIAPLNGGLIDVIGTIPTPYSSITPVSYSVSFNGSNQYLSVPANAAFQMTGDFTIEFWLYWTAHGSYGGLVGCADSNTGSAITAGWFLDFNSTSNNIQFEGQGSVAIVSTRVIPSSQWVHIAVVRSGSVITHYLNGAPNGSGTSSQSFNGVSTPLYVGIDRGASSYTAGYISNLRVVKGVAVYTGAFTPPQTPLAIVQSAVAPSIQAITGTQTSLLTCNGPTIIDGSTNAFTITNNGSAPVSTAVVPTFTTVTIINSGYTGSAGAGYTGSASSGYTGSAGLGIVGYTGSASTVVGYTGSGGGGGGGNGYTGSAGAAGAVGYTGSASTGSGASINTIDGGTSTTIFDTVDIIIEGGGA
jgi:hypothetical protein